MSSPLLFWVSFGTLWVLNTVTSVKGVVGRVTLILCFTICFLSNTTNYILCFWQSTISPRGQNEEARVSSRLPTAAMLLLGKKNELFKTLLHNIKIIICETKLYKQQLWFWFRAGSPTLAWLCKLHQQSFREGIQTGKPRFHLRYSYESCMVFLGEFCRGF